MTTAEGYIAIVKAINEAETPEQHAIERARLEGFTSALRIRGFTDTDIGNLIMAADLHYLARGIDRPMCGGQFLDWEPRKAGAA